MRHYKSTRYEAEPSASTPFYAVDNNRISLFISCIRSSGPLYKKAQDLAERLRLPLVPYPVDSPGYSLVYTEDHLELQENHYHKKSSPRPLFIDFVKGKNGYRRMRNATIRQPLARAVGIKPGFRPRILDGTAGFGADGFVLACLGCRVTLVERSPILGSLLRDGLERGLQDDAVSRIIRERITLFNADAKDILATCRPRPYSVFLDPMYPKRQKSALNKMEMRFLRTLVGDDLDGASLLRCALENAANRVVVKRPKEAPLLAEIPPTQQILMKSSRFDVYLVNRSS